MESITYTRKTAFYKSFVCFILILIALGQITNSTKQWYIHPLENHY
jgi:hypothetical protein